MYNLHGKDVMCNSEGESLTAQDRVDQVFSKMDKDGDQQITLEEFTILANQDPSLVTLFDM